MAYDPEKEGMRDSDVRGVEVYSFEGTPTGDPPDGTTHTEVESRPEETPVEGPAMPSEDGAPPEGEGPSPEGVSPTDDGEEDSPRRDQTSSRKISKRRLAKRAMFRRATAGSLLYVNENGGTGFTVPFVDIRPARYVVNVPGAKPGVEIYLPLLRIDY
jgi:hypothetical protein